MTADSTLRVIIFDCDGVLFASEAANLAFYNHIFAFFGLPEVAADDQEQLAILHTCSSHQVFEHFFGRGERYREVIAYARTVDYRQFVLLMEPQPGRYEVLGRLAGIPFVGFGYQPAGVFQRPVRDGVNRAVPIPR